MINYDPHLWSSHFFDIRGSMVREIMGRVAVCVAWSAVVVLIHHRYPSVVTSFSLHTIVGLALSLLLVFRTNSSYDRYWEGRKIWGGIVNECRNLARAVRVHLKSDPALAAEVVRWTAAFPYATMQHLRGKSDLGPIAARLPENEAAAAEATPHTPLEVATRITARLVEARDRRVISDYVFVSIDQNVQQLIDYLGGCERIRATPIPYAYMVHLRRALILYCFSLPFALVAAAGWATVFDTLLITFVFFGIEEIGVEIEDPFGEDANDLPIDEICAKIERNVLALTGADGPADAPPQITAPS